MVRVARGPARLRNPKLAALVNKPPGDLWLPSLVRNELAGHAIGYWVPHGSDDSGVDRSTNLMVYARVADIVDEFFANPKQALKEIGRQEEILIERADVWPTPAAIPRASRRR